MFQNVQVEVLRIQIYCLDRMAHNIDTRCNLHLLFYFTPIKGICKLQRVTTQNTIELLEAKSSENALKCGRSQNVLLS